MHNVINWLSGCLPATIKSYLKFLHGEQGKLGSKTLESRASPISIWELQPIHLQNLRVLCDREAFLDELPRHGTVAEIGVAQGEFTEKILAIARPQTIHLIDSWRDPRFKGGLRVVERKFAQEIHAGRVIIHKGLSTSMLSNFEDGYFDWVYIDTSHDYATTRQELEICRAKVKQGGIISGHDYVRGNWSSGFRYGVIEAVNEFCVRHHWEMIFLTHEAHRHLSYALREIPTK